MTWVLLALAVTLTGIGSACFLLSVSRGDRSLDHASDGFLAIGYALFTAWNVWTGDFVGGVFPAILAALFAWSWWRNRRRRDRALRSIGAKAKARIAALVAKVREAAKPRPVLRPAPGGAR